MGQCFSNTDHMQKIGKCKQNVKMSQKVNIWEGHNVILPICRSLQDKLGGINLLTTIFIWSQLLYQELASQSGNCLKGIK